MNYGNAEYRALQRQALANHEQVMALKEGRQPRVDFNDFQASLALKRGDPEAMADAVVKACGAYVRRSVAPIFQRVAELEARVEKLEQER